MVALLLVLLLVLLLFGAGFAAKLLWFLAVALLVLWLIGFVARGPRGALVPLVALFSPVPDDVDRKSVV